MCAMTYCNTLYKTSRDSQCGAKFRAQRDLFLKMVTDDQEHSEEISIEFAPDEKRLKACFEELCL